MNIKEIDALMKNAVKVHFVGIGGISMSSLAVITKSLGYGVSGSDWKCSPLTEKLAEKGIGISYGHSEKNISGASVIVYTAAAHFDNPELSAGLQSNVPLLTRAEYLGWLMGGYVKRIGVSGTHGKSTVTSMLTEIYLAGKLDPTVVSGAELQSMNGAYRLGGKEYFLFEACEYCDSFLSFCPTTAIVTNLEYDHADYFKDMEQLRTSFMRYIDDTDVTVFNADDPETIALKKTYSGKPVTFSMYGNGDYNAENIRYINGCAEFELVKGGEALCTVRLSVPGEHNVYNALAASAAALENGADTDAVVCGLKSFGGAKRRFEYVGKTTKGADVYNDYAHHPSEIRATLSAAKAYGKRIVCVFQPHTYSRTASLFEDFTCSFSDADITLFADIYAARETDTLGVSSELLSKKTENSVCLNTFENIASYIKENCTESDIVMILGAGDIIKVGDMVV